MGQLLLNDIEDDVLETLRWRASSTGQSIEATAREALRRGTKLSVVERAELSLRLRAMTPKDVKQTDSTLLIREDRDSR